MKQRPIFFNGDMVRAVIDGRKTQTRRIMRVQPESAEFEPRFIIDSTKRSEIDNWCWAEPGVFVNPRRSALFPCPFGVVGDRLWVRETHSIRVEPSEHTPGVAWYRESDIGRRWEGQLCWRPSIHMPRWASRITLEITGVRVERLQAISEEDAKAEGVPPAGGLLPDYPGTYLTPKGDFATAEVAFQRLWQSIYGTDSWQANPWVWVIEFKRVVED